MENKYKEARKGRHDLEDDGEEQENQLLNVKSRQANKTFSENIQGTLTLLNTDQYKDKLIRYALLTIDPLLGG